MDNDFDTSGFPDASEIAFDELAKLMVPMFRAFIRQGISAQEAAALTAAYCQQIMPSDGQGPQDGS